MPLHIDWCLLCEDARQEAGNKLTLLGFFGVLPGVQIIVTDRNAPTRLLFLFGARGEAGPQAVTCMIVAPNGRVHFDQQLRAEFDANGRAIMGAGVVGPLLQEGDFRLSFLVDNAPIYEADFNVRQGITL